MLTEGHSAPGVLDVAVEQAKVSQGFWIVCWILSPKLYVAHTISDIVFLSPSYVNCNCVYVLECIYTFYIKFWRAGDVTLHSLRHVHLYGLSRFCWSKETCWFEPWKIHIKSKTKQLHWCSFSLSTGINRPVNHFQRKAGRILQSCTVCQCWHAKHPACPVGTFFGTKTETQQTRLYVYKRKKIHMIKQYAQYVLYSTILFVLWNNISS